MINRFMVIGARCSRYGVGMVIVGRADSLYEANALGNENYELFHRFMIIDLSTGYEYDFYRPEPEKDWRDDV